MKPEDKPGLPNQPWNEDQLAKMVNSEKVRALWGSKESGDEMKVHDETGDECGENQDSKYLDEGNVVSDSDGSLGCSDRRNKSEQDICTTKECGLDKSETEHHRKEEDNHNEKSDHRDSITPEKGFIKGDNIETQSGESASGLSGIEPSSEQDIRQEKKKKRTRRGRRSRGEKTSQNDCEGREAKEATVLSPRKLNETAVSPNDHKHSVNENSVTAGNSSVSSSQQATKPKDSTERGASGNPTNKNKKEQQKERQGEKQIKQKNKPPRQHANSWSEHQSRPKQSGEENRQRKKNFKKVEAKMEESRTSGFKAEQGIFSEQETIPKERGDSHRGNRGVKSHGNINDSGTVDRRSSYKGESSRGRGTRNQGGGRRNKDRREDRGYRDRSHSAPQSQQTTANRNPQQNNRK